MTCLFQAPRLPQAQLYQTMRLHCLSNAFALCSKATTFIGARYDCYPRS